jgi:hypothetical protein
LEKLAWEIFAHPPFSPDQAPSDFRLFPKMNEFLGGKAMATDEEVKKTVTDWRPTFYDERIVKLVQRLDKCPNRE